GARITSRDSARMPGDRRGRNRRQHAPGAPPHCSRRPSRHLKYELAPEVARLAQAMGIDRLGQMIELDRRRPDGSRLEQLDDAFEMAATAPDLGPERRHIGAARRWRLLAGGNEGRAPTGSEDGE